MRIISLSPSFTEILECFKSSDLIALTDHCRLPLMPPPIPGEEGAWPRVGSPKALNFSAIDLLKPDVLLSDQNDNRPEEIRELKKKHQVQTFDVRSIQSVVDAVWSLGRLTGKTEEATRLKDEILAEEKRNLEAAKNQPPVRTLVLLWNQPYITVNFDTYISRLIESSGGVNAFHSDPVREFPIDIEDMLDKEPELLLLGKTPFPFQKRHIAPFRKLRIFSKIPIELVDGRLLSCYGPATVEALKYFRDVIGKGVVVK